MEDTRGKGVLGSQRHLDVAARPGARGYDGTGPIPRPGGTMPVTKCHEEGQRGVRPRTHPGGRPLDPRGLWRIARYAQDAARSLDARLEDEDLDGRSEAVEVREAPERLQNLSLEVSEELNAYQNRHGREG
jgi:hypothetical protein